MCCLFTGVFDGPNRLYYPQMELIEKHVEDFYGVET